MPEIYTGRKIIGGARLWFEPNGEMGIQAKIKQYGKRGKKSKRKSMTLIPAIKKNEELLAEMDSFITDSDHFYLWWLGQSGFLL